MPSLSGVIGVIVLRLLLKAFLYLPISRSIARALVGPTSILLWDIASCDCLRCYRSQSLSFCATLRSRPNERQRTAPVYGPSKANALNLIWAFVGRSLSTDIQMNIIGLKSGSRTHELGASVILMIRPRDIVLPVLAGCGRAPTDLSIVSTSY